MPTAIKRVLIYRLGSLGDTVVALPALYLVARAYPEAERRMLTNLPVNRKAPSAATVLDGTGLIHGMFRYVVATRNPLALLALWWQIVRWGPDVLIYMAPARGVKAARRDALFFRLCGIRTQIGVPLTPDLEQSRLLQDDSFEPEAARLARNLAALGDAQLDDPKSWDLRLTAAEHACAEEALRPAAGWPLIALSIGTKAQANDWGVEHWKDLFAAIARSFPRYALAITGGPMDRVYSEAIAEAWREAARSSHAGPVLNLCGELAPRESAAAFRRADVYIGHDSGQMHLAAAVQTPCVVVFSSRFKPRIWFPYGGDHRVIYHRVNCWGCALETCVVEQKKCILSITVREVLGVVSAVLERSDLPVASAVAGPQPELGRQSGWDAPQRL